MSSSGISAKKRKSNLLSEQRFRRHPLSLLCQVVLNSPGYSQGFDSLRTCCAPGTRHQVTWSPRLCCAPAPASYPGGLRGTPPPGKRCPTQRTRCCRSAHPRSLLGHRTPFQCVHRHQRRDVGVSLHRLHPRSSALSHFAAGL